MSERLHVGLRFDKMVFKIKVYTLIDYLSLAGVSEAVMDNVLRVFNELVAEGVSYEEIFSEHFPPMPPYQRYIFEGQEDADFMVKAVKQCFDLDYVSRKDNKGRWRMKVIARK